MINMTKVLGVSAREYCDSMKKEISDYGLEGVNLRVHDSFNTATVVEVLNRNDKDIEVIVGYSPFHVMVEKSEHRTYGSGTALIPVKK